MSEHQSVTTDVLVVGAGCAGISAAIEAARAGAEVVVIDRAGGGGASAMSGGLVYMGGGTPLQKACGFEDSPEEMHKFLLAACGPGSDLAKIDAYVDGSVDHFRWLVDCGVEYKASFYDGLLSEPPGDDGLMYSGGEEAYPFCEIARPAPRGHVPQMPGSQKVIGERGAGYILMQRLMAAATAAGVRIETDVRARSLTVDADGRATGIDAVQFGDDVRFRARRGVVLAGGGFAFNDAMVWQHAARMRNQYAFGTDGDDGSVIRLAQERGAGVRHMHMTTAYAMPSPLLVRSVFVNMRGQRFINEDIYFGRIGYAAMHAQDGQVVLVLDEEGFESVPEFERFGRQPTWVCETLEELEAEVGFPPGSLVATIETYNRWAKEGKDPYFHKQPKFLRPLRPPFGAIDFRTDPSGDGGTKYGFFTLGGLHTTPWGEVCKVDGDIFPGLFAAGRSTSGLPAGGYVSGCSLGDGTFFGRRAGIAAARSQR